MGERGLCVGTYNVWLMPPLVTFFAHRIGIEVSPRKMTRAKKIAKALPEGLDVIVLCEAFCEKATDALCESLKTQHGLVHRTHILGSKSNIFSSGGKFITGGIAIACRYPLEIIEEHFFGSTCARDDSLADKGVMYIKFKKPDGLLVNIFATHTQAWDEPKCRAARKAQIEKLAQIIEQKNIPRDEIVLVVGDLNVPRDVDEYEFLLKQLNCENPNKTDIENPSFNHIDNYLASGGPSSGGASTTLDYILISKEHVQPKVSQVEVCRLKANEPFEHNGKSLVDLSDHYPVFGRFTF